MTEDDVLADPQRQTETLRGSVLGRLRDLVLGGDLRPGDRLVERRLAERLGVSRVPVREALQQLEHEGLAEARPTGGLVVRALADDDVVVLFEVRAALEEVVCRRIVAGADDATLERLGLLVAAAAEAVADGRDRDAIELNAQFHQALLEAAGSDVLAAVMLPVTGRMRWLLSRHDDPATMQHDHAAIHDALRRRDADEAVRLSRAHLAAGRSAALGTLHPSSG